MPLFTRANAFESRYQYRENTHDGVFLRLLRELDPDEEKFYKEGYEEVEEMIAKLKK